MMQLQNTFFFLIKRRVTLLREKECKENKLLFVENIGS